MIYLLPHSVSHSAARFPEKEAFRCGNKSLTFGQTAAQMNQLANLLHDIGVQKGDRVGIYLNRCLETAVAIYGVMQAGCVYVPLDPKAPIERTRFLLEDCGIKILISNNAQRRNLKNLLQDDLGLNAIVGFTQVTNLPSFSWEDLQKQPTHFEAPFPITEQDVAYLMYTSGSTGNPKGIMHTHASGLAYARLTADLYGINEQDKVGNHAPIYFDICTLGYFTAPFVGACTVIASDAHIVLPSSLSKLIVEEKITVWYSVPLAIIQMLQGNVLKDKDLSALRWLIYAGEPFPPKYLRQLIPHLQETTISNVYGPTELNQCTHFNFSEAPTGDQPISIGKSWNNTVNVLLDEENEEVGEGETGELCVRSTTMMKGYWQQPELTENSFYRKSNNTYTEDIYYRTGDLVKKDAAGNLHFLGRKDHQVKVRGYRIELGSVETNLMAHPAVSEASVFTVAGENETLEIVAVIVLQKGSVVEVLEIEKFLKEKIPTYAVPKNIVVVNSFPRTGSGKVDRTTLKRNLLKTALAKTKK